MEYYHAMLIEKLLKYRRFFVCVIVEEDATDRYLGEQSAFGAMVALTCQREKFRASCFFVSATELLTRLFRKLMIRGKCPHDS